ncbi:S8 family peptidase [Deminuibacter soli]|uniref:S8 family peptidase n=1 Tax=Deminuibacter soli TaxID=2291815 RepID=UPI0013147B92|nr:S8 family peptidase [Deminuibacter soli]
MKSNHPDSLPEGARLVHVINATTYIVQFLNDPALSGANSRFHLQPANHYWKLAPALLPYHAVAKTTGKSVFQVSVQNAAAFIRYLQLHNTNVQQSGYNRAAGLFTIQADTRFVFDSIAALPYVLLIDRGHKPVHEETALADFNETFNSINTVHARYPALTGSGLIASVKENCFDTSDIDLRQRTLVTGNSASTISVHATQMATSIAGAGNTYFTGAGVAKGATLCALDFNELLPDTAAYRQYHITVQNHSYGGAIENYYGGDAAAYDASVNTDTSLVHVFSSGNSGDAAAADGLYQGITGWANITGSYKMAKNILVAGGVDSFYNVPLLSSKGPAYDGRIKPDLSAYGQDGTSGAAALVSGTCLLLQDAYRTQHSNQLPAAALVKAVLLNSADDMANPGPDYTSGYGMLNAYRAVANISNNQFARGVVQQGQSNSLQLTVPANAVRLKITLAWTDQPAAANATAALVNDLDLTVQQGDSTWLPWILHTTPAEPALQQTATRGQDTLNVAEQVTIDTPEPGDYLLHINGRRVQGNQSFYITWQWDTANHFTFTSPVANTHFIAGTNNIFKWNSTLVPERNASLYLSYNAGSSFVKITDTLNTAAPYYRWLAPDTTCVAIARVVTAQGSYTSDTFTISRQPYPAVGFACADSLLLHWPATPGVAGYRLYNLQQQYLEPVADMADTLVVLHQQPNAGNYYAVAPLFANGIQGGLSYSIDYSLQGTSCFFNNFTTDLQLQNQALLTLQLGSVYQLQRIRFEKQTPNGWQLLKNIEPVNALQYRFTDSSLLSGINTYRAVLVNSKGIALYSQLSSVYYWAKADILLFPNPVTAGGALQVLCKTPFNKTLYLYNMQGKPVLQHALQNTLETVALQGLPAGTYIAVVGEDGKRLVQQKIVLVR